jgi:phosphate uptake regulator
MQKSILSMLQDEMVALANAEREQWAAEICERQAAVHRDAARVAKQQAEHARIQAKMALQGAGLLA